MKGTVDKPRMCPTCVDRRDITLKIIPSTTNAATVLGGGCGGLRRLVQAKLYALTSKEVDEDGIEMQEADVITSIEL